MKLEVEAVARTGVRRRRFSKEFKRQVVEETWGRGASVAAVALRHRLNANLVFNWRRKYLRESATVPAAKAVKMLPVTIEVANPPLPVYHSSQSSVRKSASRALPRGVIEIEFPRHGIVRVRGSVDPDALRVALDVLCGQ